MSTTKSSLFALSKCSVKCMVTQYDAMAEAKTLSKYKKLTNNTLFVYLACKNEL